MGKLYLPETVKVAHWYLAVSTGVVVSRAQIQGMGIGKNEVAILLGLKWIIDSDLSGVNFVLRMALWRKSDVAWQYGNLQQLNIQYEKDIVWSMKTTRLDLNSMGKEEDTFIFPYPVVLIRKPQIIGHASLAAVTTGGFLYYVTEQVTDEQLAKLMVKDHA